MVCVISLHSVPSLSPYSRIFVMILCFIFTIISTWCKLCEIYSRICLLSRPEDVTEPALHRMCNDNFRWRHWHRSWHCDSSRFSTHYAMSLCNVLSRDLLSGEYRTDAPWLARKGEIRGVFCGFIIWSVFRLSHFVLFPISRYIQPIRAIFDRDIMRAYGIYSSEMICHMLVIWWVKLQDGCHDRSPTVSWLRENQQPSILLLVLDMKNISRNWKYGYSRICETGYFVNRNLVWWNFCWNFLVSDDTMNDLQYVYCHAEWQTKNARETWISHQALGLQYYHWRDLNNYFHSVTVTVIRIAWNFIAPAHWALLRLHSTTRRVQWLPALLM